MIEFINSIPMFAEPMATEALHAVLAFLMLGLIVALTELWSTRTQKKRLEIELECYKATRFSLQELEEFENNTLEHQPIIDQILKFDDFMPGGKHHSKE
jgi:hypothetical protein